MEAASGPTFSEHWHRVAGRRLALVSGTRVERQFFMGELWYVVEDALQNRFYRLHPAAYRFLARLDGRRTIEQAWQEVVEADPEHAPTQDQVIRLLSQMRHAALVRGDVAADARGEERRRKKRQWGEWRGFLGGGISMRVPLWNPDALLRRTRVLGKIVFSRPAFVIWCVVVGFAIKAVADHAAELATAGAGLIAPSNLPLLLVAFAVLKALHEAGHAYACAGQGGRVSEVGAMFMFLSPFPYVDTTSSWGFRSRWQRAAVGAAGIYVELFAAALAALAWSGAGDPLIRGITYNMMVVGSVSTLLFNGNPLMRYDAYYVMSDLLGIPNLNSRAQQMFRWTSERFLFGVRGVASPARTRGEGWFLALYAVVSSLYRFAIFVGLIVWISSRYLLVGLVLAALGLIGLVVTPMLKFLRYLASAPSLERVRPRAVRLVAIAAAGLVALLVFVPFPRAFTVEGIVESENYVELHLKAPGIPRDVPAPPGSRVAKDAALIELENPELALELEAARAGHARTQAELEKARAEALLDTNALASRVTASQRQIERLQEQIRSLEVRAPFAGVWAAGHIEEHLGRWLPKGESVGLIVDDRAFRFRAVVPESDSANLFRERIRRSGVRLRGQAGRVLNTGSVEIWPVSQTLLPSGALGWKGGGAIAVTGRDEAGREAAEPFFEIRATLQKGDAVLLHGQSGFMRLAFEPEPVLFQARRKLEQWMQKRFRQ